ncbi:hypothetical protein B0A50_04314 [Salinomyces thailandicus]|uniref:Phosphoglycerate mutase-like protein n=1 Tax=Salinomyces thailandicus TaxID=706561 RepID=A0A4U0TWV9_9PEZI|nr:hypothetical protein B0A50_04314 [Salinomyces thailandica]
MLIRTSLALASYAATASATRGHRQYRKHGASTNDALLTDIDVISQYWGQIAPYQDNNDRHFGVEDVGLPDGCQIEQAHTLQRHAQRFPIDQYDDGANDERFAAKVLNFSSTHSHASFSGPLKFLNSYQYQMGESYLTGLGAATEFESGVNFWNRYGRILYDAVPGQLQYNATYQNSTARPKPVLRTTSQSRMRDSEISWALGFFGPSFYAEPMPSLDNFVNGSLFDVVVISEEGTENNTLASYISCFEESLLPYYGDEYLFFEYVPLYICNATARLNHYAPEGFRFNDNDTYAMQSICAYEHAYIGMSDFCNFFTEDEWAAFEQTLDMEYYYDYGFGHPTGRAQGLGYQQELLARLTNQYITTSNSSVNSTLTDNPSTFPLARPFYADFTHDDIIVSVLASMSLDYFHSPPSLTTYPPDPDRPFILSNLTPFGARLITEVIGCADPDPETVHNHRTQYYPTQYGYDASNAPHKFIRMRLNNGILPLETIRGGACEGRTDGMCGMEDFLASQYEAEKLANYQFACFANYTIVDPVDGRDFDGTVNNGTNGIKIGEGQITADDV